ncbi:MAG: glycoside hydrolase family 125 protein [Bacteroidota bacterium]
MSSTAPTESTVTQPAQADFPKVRATKRNFESPAVEQAINQFGNSIKDKELAWLFNNCFPNTLDTTVTFKQKDGKPDTYVITGDMDAMWMRDSSAQVYPYISFATQDKNLQQLIAGVINRQVDYILKDPYGNSFYDDPKQEGHWAHDETAMQPGIHERKWAIDSLCYPIRLAYQYWKITGDATPFDANWKKSIALILKTFKEQQRKTDQGPYSFQRNTQQATDSVPMNGYGYPAKPNGLICSTFRPSDDATVYLYFVPANFFAVVSLKQASQMIKTITKDTTLANQLMALATEVELALKKHAIVNHPDFGNVYAFEVNGYGSCNLMDDANVPSLLSLPYLGAVSKTDPVYLNTRKMLLSAFNPFFVKGKAGEGIGSPHASRNNIWPMSITMRGLTSTNDNEIKHCIAMLKNSNAGTGFMHESFNKDDPKRYARSWFAWGNTLFGEFLWETYKTRPYLLS